MIIRMFIRSMSCTNHGGIESVRYEASYSKRVVPAASVRSSENSGNVRKVHVLYLTCIDGIYM